MEQSNIRRRAWIISAALHLVMFIAIAIEVYLKIESRLDLVFYIFCVPGFLVGFPFAMLFGVGGAHGEGVFFGILFGLPFNVWAYYGLSTLLLKAIDHYSRRGSHGKQLLDNEK